MAQINNPAAAKEDDGLNTILAGLQIYNGVQDIKDRNAKKKDPPLDEAEAMKRRMEQMQKDLEE